MESGNQGIDLDQSCFMTSKQRRDTVIYLQEYLWENNPFQTSKMKNVETLFNDKSLSKSLFYEYLSIFGRFCNLYLFMCFVLGVLDKYLRRIPLEKFFFSIDKLKVVNDSCFISTISKWNS